MEGRQVLLVLDPFKAHEVASRTLGHPLKNVSLHFSPGFLANRYLPPDLGAIYTFKALYRKNLLEYILACGPSKDDWYDFLFQPEDSLFKCAIDCIVEKINSVDIKRALDWITSAWEKTTCDALTDSWARSGLLYSRDYPPPSIDGLPISPSNILLPASRPCYVHNELLSCIDSLIYRVYEWESQGIYAEYDILTASAFVSHQAEYFEESPFQFLDIAIAPFKPLSDRVTEESHMNRNNAETTDEPYSGQIGEGQVDSSLNITGQDHSQQRDLTRRPSLLNRNYSYESSLATTGYSTPSNHNPYHSHSHSQFSGYSSGDLTPATSTPSYNLGRMPATPTGMVPFPPSPNMAASVTQSPMEPRPTTSYSSPCLGPGYNSLYNPSHFMSWTGNTAYFSIASTTNGNETESFQHKDELSNNESINDDSQYEYILNNDQLMQATNLPNDEGLTIYHNIHDTSRLDREFVEKVDQNTEKTSMLAQVAKQGKKLLSKARKISEKRKSRKGKKE